MSHDHAYNRLTAAGSDHTGPHRHPFNTSHLGTQRTWWGGACTAYHRRRIAERPLTPAVQEDP